MAMRCLTALCCVLPLFAQQRTVAITVDDLLYAGSSKSLETAKDVNRKILAALQAHHAPATGFVNQKTVEQYGNSILKDWISRGFDLGNHTYSHADANTLSVQQIQDEIVRGESAIKPLMNRKLAYFRFPFNHTGDTQEKHDAIAAFLSQRGYQPATCTIDTSDYLFNDAYERMLANHDQASANKLRTEYLAYTSTEIDYYAALNKQVLGYAPPEVMLLHDNRLNADVLDLILKIFERKQYRFVSLAEAQSDPAYRIPETYITKFGMMWGYRWAKLRGVKVNGSLETEPAKWILEYGKTN